MYFYNNFVKTNEPQCERTFLSKFRSGQIILGCSATEDSSGLEILDLERIWIVMCCENKR